MADITDQNSTDQRSNNDNAPDVVCENSKSELNGMDFLQFPEVDIPKYYSMKFTKYVTETGIARATGSASPASKKSFYSEINLPLPTQIIDNSSIGYSTPSLGLLGRGAGEVANFLDTAAQSAANRNANTSAATAVGTAASDFVSNLKLN